jgi:Flp pilus assembly protein TadB
MKKILAALLALGLTVAFAADANKTEKKAEKNASKAKAKTEKNASKAKAEKNVTKK